MRAVAAVEPGGTLRKRLEHEAGHRLSVLEQEGGFVAADLQHGAAADAASLFGTEAWVEEAGVMDPELAHRRIDRRHLGGVEGRDLDRLLGSQNVEFAWIQQQLAPPRLQRLP